jgi:AsmA family protein
LALDLEDSSIAALAGGGDAAIDAPVYGRLRLTGVGSTIRDAVGTGSGYIGLYAADGVLPEKLARLLGFDIGAVFSNRSDKASLRCAAIGLDLQRGLGSVAPLVVDTSLSQSRGSGTITFPDEAIAVSLTGAPKAKVTLRLPGSAFIRGTIREPAVMVPKGVHSVGNVLKAIGRAITGRSGPRATDADCSDLRRKVIE